MKSEKILLANIANSQLGRFCRELAQQYARHGRTITLYRYTALAIAREAVKSHRWEEARRYRLEVARTMRKFERKGGEQK